MAGRRHCAAALASNPISATITQDDWQPRSFRRLRECLHRNPMRILDNLSKTFEPRRNARGRTGGFQK